MNCHTAILNQSNNAATWRWTHLSLVLLLLLTLHNGLLWSAVTPLWQGPDEDGHFAATQFVAEHLRLPGHDNGFRADEVLLAADLADTGKLYNHPKLRQAFGNGYVLFDYPGLNFFMQRKNTYPGTELSVGAVWGTTSLASCSPAS